MNELPGLSSLLRSLYGIDRAACLAPWRKSNAAQGPSLARATRLTSFWRACADASGSADAPREGQLRNPLVAHAREVILEWKLENAEGPHR